MAGLDDLLNDGGALKPPSLSDAVGGSSNKELMADARMALSGNWGMGVLGLVLYYAFAFSLSMFTVAATMFVTVAVSASGANVELASSAMSFASQVVQILVSGALAVGFCSYYLVIAQEGEARLEYLFTGFRRFWTAFGAYFFYTLFIFLWMLLFIIPGIIATFRYAMVFFVVADDEECGSLEAIRRSKEVMKGNKWKLFCLYWRFFWWGLLATFFTFGIGYFWLLPYMQTSFAKFYEDVK